MLFNVLQELDDSATEKKAQNRVILHKFPQRAAEDTKSTFSLALRGNMKDPFGPFAPSLPKLWSHFGNRASLCPSFHLTCITNQYIFVLAEFHTFTSVHSRSQRAEQGTLACEMSGPENRILLEPFPSLQPHQTGIIKVYKLCFLMVGICRG